MFAVSGNVPSQVCVIYLSFAEVCSLRPFFHPLFAHLLSPCSYVFLFAYVQRSFQASHRPPSSHSVLASRLLPILALIMQIPFNSIQFYDRSSHSLARPAIPPTRSYSHACNICLDYVLHLSDLLSEVIMLISETIMLDSTIECTLCIRPIPPK